MRSDLTDPPHLPSSLVEVVGERARTTPDRRAFTFLENGEVEATGGLSFAELDARASFAARSLRERGATGRPVLLLLPPSLDFVVAFFACLYAGAVAVPVSPPGSRRTLPRLLSILADARPELGVASSALLSRIRGWLAETPDVQPPEWWVWDGEEAPRDRASGQVPGTFSDRAADGSGSGAPGSFPGGAAGETGIAGWDLPRPDDLAFLQYTSGSTASPKGVMVSHGNLLHNQGLIRDACQHDADSVFVSWLPLYHDLGLIGNMLQAAFVGAHCVLMSPVAFLQRPVRWLRAISRYRATTSGGPNFAYDLCARRIAAQDRADLDLSSWRVAFNGAEPVRASTLRAFADAFAGCGFRSRSFYPCYGLAEATLMVSGGDPDTPPQVARLEPRALEQGVVETAAEPSPGDAAPAAEARELVACGRVLGDLRVRIVDPEKKQPLAPGRVGEIWLAGGSVATGYWGRRQESREAFEALLDGGEGPFLRTGDLGFLRDGELFLAGRLKDLVILRGRNLYPQDVELTAAASHPAFADGLGAAFAVDHPDGERLVVVQESARLDATELAAAAERLRQAVVESHEVPVHEVVLIRQGTLPRTTSGKVQRRHCRQLLADGELSVVSRSQLAGEAETWRRSGLTRDDLLAATGAERRAAVATFLAEQVATALHVPPSRLSDDRPVTALGLDSLSGVELAHALERGLGVPLAPAELLAGPTLAQLTSLVLDRLGDGAPVVVPVPAPTSMAAVSSQVPLTGVQEALWFLHRLAPDSGAYNVSFALELGPEVDRGELTRALARAVARHPALGAVFSEVEGRPVQRLGAVAGLDLTHHDAATWDDTRLDAELSVAAHAPFDLAAGPPVRVALFHRPAGAVLLLVVHHLVFDGWSLWQVLAESGRLYRQAVGGGDADLPASDLGFGDYVLWHRGVLAGERGDELERFWARHLEGDLPPLALPSEGPPHADPAPAGGSVPLRVDGELARSLERLADERGTTLFTVLLAAYQVLLARLTGEDRFLVGTAVSGRTHRELDRLVGCVYNVLPVVADVADDPPFVDYLARVGSEMSAALAHQEYPSRRLAELAGRSREAPGLFQVTFLWQAAQRLGEAELRLEEGELRVRLPGLEAVHRPVERRAARQELELELMQAEGGLMGAFHYDALRFRRPAVARMARQFRNLLQDVATRPQTPVAALSWLSDDEIRELVAERNRPPRVDPGAVTLDDLFARLDAAPQQVAAAAPGIEMTYQELDRRANALAALLQGRSR